MACKRSGVQTPSAPPSFTPAPSQRRPRFFGIKKGHPPAGIGADAPGLQGSVCALEASQVTCLLLPARWHDDGACRSVCLCGCPMPWSQGFRGYRNRTCVFAVWCAVVSRAVQGGARSDVGSPAPFSPLGVMLRSRGKEGRGPGLRPDEGASHQWERRAGAMRTAGELVSLLASPCREVLGEHVNEQIQIFYHIRAWPTMLCMR